MSGDLVSIITPLYKSEKFISQTIESVLRQTYTNWEMIIVDDVSPDNSDKIVIKYCKKDSRIKFLKLKVNSGPAIARNTAIKEAKGRYIAFLDADDLWYENKLEKQIRFMKENNLAFTYSSYDLMDEKGKSLGTFITKDKINYERMLKTSSVGCLTVVYDVKMLGKMYMENMGHEDYILWLKILKNIDYAMGIIEPLATYRIVNNSVSSNKLKAARYTWKIYREVEGLNIFNSIYYFIHYVVNGLIKYRQQK